MGIKKHKTDHVKCNKIMKDFRKFILYYTQSEKEKVQKYKMGL